MEGDMEVGREEGRKTKRKVNTNIGRKARRQEDGKVQRTKGREIDIGRKRFGETGNVGPRRPYI